MPELNTHHERLRWTVFALATAAFWLSFFHRVSPAALAAELTATFAVSGAALGAMAATYFYIYTVMQVPAGVLVDTLGPRRVLAAGGAIAGAGALTFGGADTAFVAAAGRLLIGLGVSVAFISVMKLNASWFSEHRFATATGLANSLAITGALAATAPLAWLITLVSWRTVFLVIGLVSIAVAVLTAMVVRDRPPGAAPSRVPLAQAEQRWHHGLAEVLRNRHTWPGFWVNFGISGSYMSFVGLWAVPWLTQVYGMSSIAASAHASAMLLAFACSVGGMGLLSDHLQRRRPIIIVSAVFYVGSWIAVVAGVPAQWAIVVFVMMGLSVTGFSLSWSCAKEVNRPRYSGMATSVANTGGFLAAGILQPVVGAVLDVAGAGGASAAEAFRMGLAVLALCACGGLVGGLFIRETRCRNIWAAEISGTR